ncbi:MAG: signal peptidase II [Clostridia bacterium]|nr:signal peptidase II [Clostridia bacterium]
MIIYFIVAALLIAIDQITKWLTVANIPLYSQGPVIINKVLSLTYHQNTGASWSMLEDNPILLIIMTVAILIGATVYIVKAKPQSKLFRWSASLIYAGALSNLADRIFRGFVVDMIKTDFMDFPIFNVADCCVVTGTALLCLYILMMPDSKDKKNIKKANH